MVPIIFDIDKVARYNRLCNIAHQAAPRVHYHHKSAITYHVWVAAQCLAWVLEVHSRQYWHVSHIIFHVYYQMEFKRFGPNVENNCLYCPSRGSGFQLRWEHWTYGPKLSTGEEIVTSYIDQAHYVWSKVKIIEFISHLIE